MASEREPAGAPRDEEVAAMYEKQHQVSEGMQGDASAFSPPEKAAALLIALGPEQSARVLEHLTEEEVETLTAEVANVRGIAPDMRDRVVNEFVELLKADTYILEGGIEYAQEMLEGAVGVPKAREIIDRLSERMMVRPFEVARKADLDQLLSFLRREHPQTIALILAHLEGERAAEIVAALEPEVQITVARRLATMERISPQLVEDVEAVLKQRLEESVVAERSQIGGVESVVEVLNHANRATERTILDALEAEDPELAEEIRKRMFVFEDIVMLDDQSLQRVLQEVDFSRDLPMALKAASNEVKRKIYNNISRNAAENVKEELEFLGPVRLREVEEAQQAIVNKVRQLDEEGEIVVARAGGDEVIV